MGRVAEYPELKNTTLVKGDEVLLRYSATGLEREVEESWGGRGGHSRLLACRGGRVRWENAVCVEHTTDMQGLFGINGGTNFHHAAVAFFGRWAGRSATQPKPRRCGMLWEMS